VGANLFGGYYGLAVGLVGTVIFLCVVWVVFFFLASGFALLASYFFSVAKKSNQKTPPPGQFALRVPEHC